MKRLIIVLENCKSVSANSLYVGRGKGKRKTDKYLYLLSVAKFAYFKNKPTIEEFKKSYDETKEGLRVLIVNELKNLVVKKNKKERISRTCLDVDNSTKSVIDSIFPYLETNDSNILEVVAIKKPSKENKIIVIIEIVERSGYWSDVNRIVNKYISI